MSKWYDAESGKVTAHHDWVEWRLSPDEAEEVADFIERATVPHDAARVDVAALRSAIEDARHAG